MVTGKPWAAVRALWIAADVYVFVEEGVIPAIPRVYLKKPEISLALTK